MFTFFTSLAILLMPPFIWAQESIILSKKPIEITKKAFDQIKEINQNMNVEKKSCNEQGLDRASSCIDITDHFCSQLWNEKNQGNMKIFDGEIKAGTSDSGLSWSNIENERALIDSFSNLPDDTKTLLAPIIKRLQNLLDNEENDPEWHKARSIIKEDLNNAMKTLINQRFEAHNPTLKISGANKWTIDQILLYTKEFRDAADELTIAKYSKNPNWTRVEKIFPLIKDNLAQVIDKLNIPDERKKTMKEKILSIKLSLPLQDPNTVMASQECATTEMNAFYAPFTNQFTVCAGLFNSYQADSALAFVIAHEIGHAIDSEDLSQDDWLTHSPVANVLKKLIHAKAPVYKCDEWKKINKTILNTPTSFNLKNLNPFEKLYTCFRGDENLEKLTKENISLAAKAIATDTISTYATNNSFANFVQKLITTETGEQKENENYLRPDNFLKQQKKYDDINQTRDVDPIEIFNQSFICSLNEANLTVNQFETASKEIRSKVFKNAINETTKIIQIHDEDYFQYCGHNCSDLTTFDLAVNPRETNADWFATMAFPAFLKNLAPENRTQAGASTTSLFCRNNMANTAPELSLIEKKFSLEPHPDDRSRRVSLYTQEVADLTNCKLNDTDKENALCKP